MVRARGFAAHARGATWRRTGKLHHWCFGLRGSNSSKGAPRLRFRLAVARSRSALRARRTHGYGARRARRARRATRDAAAARVAGCRWCPFAHSAQHSCCSCAACAALERRHGGRARTAGASACRWRRRGGRQAGKGAERNAVSLSTRGALSAVRAALLVRSPSRRTCCVRRKRARRNAHARCRFPATNLAWHMQLAARYNEPQHTAADAPEAPSRWVHGLVTHAAHARRRRWSGWRLQPPSLRRCMRARTASPQRLAAARPPAATLAAPASTPRVQVRGGLVRAGRCGAPRSRPHTLKALEARAGRAGSTRLASRPARFKPTRCCITRAFLSCTLLAAR